MFSKKISQVISFNILLISTLVCSNGHAAEGNNYYVALTGEYVASANGSGHIAINGASIPGSVNYDNGWGGLASVGYYITPSIRAELEGGYRDIKQKNVSFTYLGTAYTTISNEKNKAYSAMGNTYYDFQTGSNITPYIGVGMGWAHQQDNGGADAFAYQGMLGVNYKILNDSSIFAGYRYLGTSDFSKSGTISGISYTEKVRLKASSIDVGYRYNF